MSRLPTVDTLLAFIGDRPIEAFDVGAGLDGAATLSPAFGAGELVITGAHDEVSPLAEAAPRRMRA